MKKIALAVLLLYGVAQAKQKDKLAVTLTSDIIVKSKSNHKKVTFTKRSTKSTKKVIVTAKKYLGVKYKFGGTTRKGIDCSSFTKTVMKKHGHNLPRTASQQASAGVHIDKKKLRPGDLVFFKGTYKRGISHVGIYLGSDRFIHASSGKGKVTISRLSKAYYKRHYAGARRV